MNKWALWFGALAMGTFVFVFQDKEFKYIAHTLYWLGLAVHMKDK